MPRVNIALDDENHETLKRYQRMRDYRSLDKALNEWIKEHDTTVLQIEVLNGEMMRVIFRNGTHQDVPVVKYPTVKRG